MPAAAAFVCERERCGPRRIIRACVTTPDSRKRFCRSKTTCTRPCTVRDTYRYRYMYMDCCSVCNSAARARCVCMYIYIYTNIYIYIYVYVYGFSVLQRIGMAWRRLAPTSTRRGTTSVPVTREYPLSGSAPTAWRRAAPTSTRRGSRRARPGRPSCSTSTCVYSQYSQYRLSPSAVAERLGAAQRTGKVSVGLSVRFRSKGSI